jgi:hypothetical protein
VTTAKAESGVDQERSTARTESTRDAEVSLICVTRRGKDGAERRYIVAPDGSLLHRDHDALYPIMSACIAAGWKKVHVDSLVPKGDHYEVTAWIEMTPPKRRAKDSPPLASVPALDRSRSTPKKAVAVRPSPPEGPQE